MFPVPIGADEMGISLPPANAELLATCHTFIVDELRTARRFLKKAGYPYPIDDTVFLELNEHTTHEEIGNYLDAIERGENIGLLSEAGLPCVADPGAMITKERAAAIRHLEERLHREHQTQIFIEAPYRNNQMLESLSSVLQPNTMICVACDLTLPTQYIHSLTAAKWQKERTKVDLHKRNTVFLIGE